MSMPTDEEVEDYDFRLRLEAEENGDEPEDDILDDEDGDGGRPWWSSGLIRSIRT